MKEVKKMKLHRINAILLGISLLGIALLALSCGKKAPTGVNNDDRTNIEGLLLGSGYTSPDDGAAVTDDGRTDPQPGLEFAPGLAPTLADTIPFLRFVRKLNRPIETHIDIQIPAPGKGAGTALATITHYPTGTMYVDNTDNNNPFDIKTRTINGTAVRQVYLEKVAGWGRRWGGWVIKKISTLDHQSSPSNVRIVRVEAYGSSGTFYSSDNPWVLTDPTKLYEKDSLPTFAPGDTAYVTVTVSGDSSWVFLHRGCRWWHKRDPFYRESASVFQRSWIISDSDSLFTPRIRHAGVDAISYKTLFGGDNEPYDCQSWALAYVVKKPDELPPEE